MSVSIWKCNFRFFISFEFETIWERWDAASIFRGNYVMLRMLFTPLFVQVTSKHVSVYFIIIPPETPPVLRRRSLNDIARKKKQKWNSYLLRHHFLWNLYANVAPALWIRNNLATRAVKSRFNYVNTYRCFLHLKGEQRQCKWHCAVCSHDQYGQSRPLSIVPGLEHQYCSH